MIHSKFFFYCLQYKTIKTEIKFLAQLALQDDASPIFGPH